MNDMSKGKILPQILNFAFFVFIGGLMQNLYLVINSIILGQFVGNLALASIGIASSINFVVIGFCMGITQGFSINMAQSFGAGDFVRLRKLCYNAKLLTFYTGVVLTVVLAIINTPLLKLMGTPSVLFDMTHSFLFVLYLGCIPLLYYNLYSGILRSVGNSAMPIVFLSLSVIMNTILTYIFVSAFNLGLVGTAISTIISQSTSVFFSMLYVKKKYPILSINKEEKIQDKHLMKRLLNQGIPMGLQFSFTGIGFMVVQSFLNGFDTIYIAGFSIATRIQNILNNIYIAIGAAIATFTSQNFGARKYHRIKKGINSAAIVSVCLSIVSAFIITHYGEAIAGLFSKDKTPELIGATTNYFNTVFWGYPILSLLILYRNALQGHGLAFIAMCAGFVELALRICVVVFFTEKHGYDAICHADLVAWIATGLVVMMTYYFFQFKKYTYK